MSRRRATSEEGTVLVISAIFLPVLVLFAALAVDVANWYVHDRHLQTQADAAALAAVKEIRFPQSTCVESEVRLAARQFAGVKDPGSPGTALFNTQVGKRDDVVKLAGTTGLDINKKRYYRKPGQTPTDPDDTVEQDACVTKTVDVKLTELDLPWFFDSLGIVDHIDAHARAKVLEITGSKESTPLGFPDPRPEQAYVWIIDESRVCADSSSAPVCVVSHGQLEDLDTVDPATQYSLYAKTLPPATLAAATGDRLSVVVGLSSIVPDDDEPATTKIDANIVKWCANTRVNCYDRTSAPAETDLPTRGISHIRTFDPSTDATPPAAPKVRGVWLTAPTSAGAVRCTSLYFETVDGECRVTVNARVDFGTGADDPRLPKVGSGNNAQDRVKVCATVDGDGKCPNGNSTNGVLTYTPSATAGQPGTWVGEVEIDKDNGRSSIELGWEKIVGTVNGTECKDNKPCTGTFNGQPVQYVTSSDVDDPSASAAGPIGTIVVSEPTPPVAPDANRADETPNSFARCTTGTPTGTGQAETSCTHTLRVQIGIKGSLRTVQSPSDPPVTLRAAGNGSRNQAVFCEKGSSLETDLINGCVKGYKVNTGEECPDPNVLWASDPPWPCVAVQTGGEVGKLGDGLNYRIHCADLPTAAARENCAKNPTCRNPNNWNSPTKGFFSPAGLDPTDPRIVKIFITPFGSFSDQGQGTIPVTAFATMYITDWRAPGSNDNPCTKNLPATQRPENNGDVVGYFITYVDDEGTPGSTTCKDSSIATCVAVLTD